MNIVTLPTSLMGLAVFLAAGAFDAAAQASERYRGSRDTLRYESTNSYFMFFVRGADTLGQPVTTRTRESHVISPAGSQLAAWVRLESVEGHSFRKDETYALTPSGRVVAIGGKPAAAVPHARVDLLPRLPDPSVALAPGVRWKDTVSNRALESHGPTHYSVTSEFRVVRVFDSLGTRIAHLVSEGSVRLRQGGWQDSANATVWWQEVSGPVIDSVWFDVRNGRLLADIMTMRLSGSGGVGPKRGGATLSSGLYSRVARRRL